MREGGTMTGFVATAEVDISASPQRVWKALVDPEQIERYFFGSHVESDFRPGSSIVWKGEYDGTAYEDRGEVVEVWPARRLRLTHFSPLSGQEDVPENYHELVYVLEPQGTRTHLTLTQDNNGSPAEAEHSAENWKSMLIGLKDLVERG
jgi:uncharacterized protein YndB with AHSA1/START domain